MALHPVNKVDEENTVMFLGGFLPAECPVAAAFTLFLITPICQSICLQRLNMLFMFSFENYYAQSGGVEGSEELGWACEQMAVWLWC